MSRSTTLLRRLVVAWLVAGTVVAGLGAAAVTAPADAGGQAPAAQQTDATMNLTSTGAPPGETVTIQLRTTASDVAGYQANVTFDSDVVGVTSVTGVDMDDPVANVQNDSGWVFLTQSAATGSDATVLAEITFQVSEDASVGDGTDLALVEADSLVNDGDANELDVSLDDGRIDVTENAVQTNGGDGNGESGLLGGSMLLLVGGVGVGAAVGIGVFVGLKFA